MMKVLFVVDHSEPSEKALSWFLDHFYKEGSELLLLVVGSPPISLGSPGDASFSAAAISSVPSRLHDLRYEFQIRFTNICLKYKIPFKVISEFESSEKTGHFISKTAEEQGANMLVVMKKKMTAGDDGFYYVVNPS